MSWTRSKLFSPELQKCYFLYIYKQICSRVPIFLYFYGPKHLSGNCYVSCFLSYWQNSFARDIIDYSFLQIPDVPKPSQDIDSIEDWPAELRPSMRKLRQGMDSLCKTSKLTCSALRLRQTAEAVNLSHQIKYRRDVCFSQALTSLVTGLMNRLWCTAPSAAEADETFLKVYTLMFK